MLNILCVNSGNYLGRGEEYVEKLERGVWNNLEAPYRFHVVTDEIADGWWNKIALFKPGRFTGRCIFFDLDTIIVGSLYHFSNYQGPFAALSDFYHPEHLQSSVMAWTAGECDHVFTNWEAAGMPQFHERGDQFWIEKMMPQAQRLQNLFPGQFVSLKAHCGAGIPDNARVVCFHGQPRPHHLAELMSHW